MEKDYRKFVIRDIPIIDENFKAKISFQCWIYCGHHNYRCYLLPYGKEYEKSEGI